MAKYFETFPKLLYDIDNTKNFKLVTDIFRRIKVREQLKENAALFSTYDVPSGEQPETTSYKHFGTTDYFWIILLLNDITNMLTHKAYIIMKLHNQVALQQVMVQMTIHIK